MPEPSHTPRKRLDKLQLTMWEWIRAGLLNRRPYYFSALTALSLLTIIILINTLYISAHDPQASFPIDLLRAVTFLTLNNIGDVSHDAIGSILIVLNILFTILFAQSVFDSARVLFNPLRIKDRQGGRAIVQHHHHIICGAGRMGYRVAARLVAARERVVVIESSWETEFVQPLLRMGVPIINGDARHTEILERAGVMRARSIVGVIDGDLIDLEIALAARQMNTNIAVFLRTFNEYFDNGVESFFGRASAFSASALAAPTFTAATLAKNIVYALPLGDHGNQIVAIERLRLPTARQSADDLHALEQRYGVRILKLATHEVAGHNDAHLNILGTMQNLDVMRAELAASTELAAGFRPTDILSAAPGHPVAGQDTHSLHVSTSDQRVIMICGLGKMGFRMVTRLHQWREQLKIVVIQRTEEANTVFSQIVSRYENVEMVHGDARDMELLVRAGLKDAMTFAAVTSDDELNVRVALEARRCNPHIHIVLRVFSEELADELAMMFNIVTSYSVSNLASPTFAAAAMFPGIELGFMLDQELYAMRSAILSPTSPLVGATLATICHTNHIKSELPDISIIGVWRGDTIFRIPSDDFRLEHGDRIACVGKVAHLREFWHQHQEHFIANDEVEGTSVTSVLTDSEKLRR